MRKKIVCIICLICMVTACAKEDIYNGESDSVQRVDWEEKVFSEGEKAQKQVQYQKDYIKNTLTKIDGVDDVEIEIVCEGDAFEVNATVDYASSLQNIEDMNKSIEEALKNYFPEATKVAVTENKK